MPVNLKSLIGKLNESTRGALEAAAGLCLSRTHYDIEIEHFLLKLLDQPDGDMVRILNHFGVDKSRLTGELNRSLDKLKSGNARTPAISPSVLNMLSQAWMIGSIDYNAAQVRTGFTALALTTNDELSRLMRDITREFQKVEAEALRKDFLSIVEGSAEQTLVAAAGPAGAPGAAKPGAGGKTANLDQYTVNLTANAKAGKIDAVLGRDHEIRQIIDILMRRRQNNPILTGEAGVTFAVVMVNLAIVAVLTRRRWRPLAAATAAVAILHIGGVFAIAGAASAPSIRVAGVQPAITRREAATNRGWNAALGRLERLTREAQASSPKPALVVWPETAVRNLGNSPALAKRLKNLAGSAGVPIILGSSDLQTSLTWSDSGIRVDHRYHNAAWMIPARGAGPPPSYKMGLLPFADYRPPARWGRRARACPPAPPGSPGASPPRSRESRSRVGCRRVGPGRRACVHDRTGRSPGCTPRGTPARPPSRRTVAGPASRRRSRWRAFAAAPRTPPGRGRARTRRRGARTHRCRPRARSAPVTGRRPIR